MKQIAETRRHLEDARRMAREPAESAAVEPLLGTLQEGPCPATEMRPASEPDPGRPILRRTPASPIPPAAKKKN